MYRWKYTALLNGKKTTGTVMANTAYQARHQVEESNHLLTNIKIVILRGNHHA